MIDDVDFSNFAQVGDVPRRTKRTFDPAWKERLVVACLRPGVSVSKLALENNLNANQLRKWVRQYRLSQQGHASRNDDNRDEASQRPVFLPVIEGRLLDHDAKNTAPILPRAQPDPYGGADRRSAGSHAHMSVTLPNGVQVTLDLSDTSALVAMIGALGNVPSVS